MCFATLSIEITFSVFSHSNYGFPQSLSLSRSKCAFQKINKNTLPSSTFANWTAILILFHNFSSVLVLLCFWPKIKSYPHRISHTSSFSIPLFTPLSFPKRVLVLLFIAMMPHAGHKIMTFPVAIFNSWLNLLSALNFVIFYRSPSGPRPSIFHFLSSTTEHSCVTDYNSHVTVLGNFIAQNLG